MQKQQKLTDEQIKLINDNYHIIKGRLQSYFVDVYGSKSKNKNFTFSKINEVLSFLPDLALEYDPESSNGKSFVNFAVDRCVKRTIDEFRSMNRHLRINKRKRGVLNPIKQEILSEKGFCAESDLMNALIERNLDPTDFLNLKEFKQQNVSVLSSEQKLCDDLVGVDMEDHIESIGKKAEEYFAELPGTGMKSRNKLARVRKKLVREYLIPLAKGNKTKSLSQIGAEVDLSEGRLSQLIKDDNMKNFIKQFYKEFDLNDTPVVTNSSMD